MARLLRLAATTTVLCAIVVLAVKILGNAQPDPLANWFTNVDGSRCTKPCLFGIQPGVTKYGEALHIITRHPVTRSIQLFQTLFYPFSSDNVIYGNDQFCIIIWQNQDSLVGGIIVSIQGCNAKTAPQKLALGQLMVTLGNPESVSLGKYGIAPDYYYFLGGQLFFQAKNNENVCTLSPDVNYELLTLDVADSRDLPLPEWKGFAQRSKYAESPNDIKPLSNCSR